jgi:peroxiredoxin
VDIWQQVRRIRLSLDAAIMLLLVASIVFNMVLLRQIRRGRGQQVGRALWDVGTVAPPLTLEGVGGTSVSLDWEREPKLVVLYVLSPDCKWCERNAAGLRALLDNRTGSYRVVPIELRPPPAEMIPLPHSEAGDGQHFYISSRTRQAGYGFGATPQTMVIGQGGRVLANWRGAYTTPQVQSEIRQLLGVAVPLVVIPGRD